MRTSKKYEIEFECKKISVITDDLGCTIIFSEFVNENPNEKYVLLQRTFPEDEFEEAYRYLETNNHNFGGELKTREVFLSKSKFNLKTKKGNIVLIINPTEKEYLDLKEAVQIIIWKKNILRIEE